MSNVFTLLGSGVRLTMILFLFFSTVFLHAQEQENVVILEHADSLVGMELNGEKARLLIGDVQFRQGKTRVTCSRAIQYLVSNKVSLEGVVEVREDSMRMVGMRGMYDGNTRTAEAFERVMLEDPTTVLRATYGKYFIKDRRAFFSTNVQVEDTASLMISDSLLYFRDEGKSIAMGHVRVVNSRNNVTIAGDRLENDKKSHYSKVTGDPRVLQIDTSGARTDTLTVSAIVLESYQDSLDRLIATDSVLITRGGLAAEASKSIYFTKLDSIRLEGNPIVWYSRSQSQDNQVTGDSIFIKLQKRKLETIYVRRRAFAVSLADSAHPRRFNQMSGNEIILHFSSDKLRQINVNTTATSLYYLFDQDKGNGMNKTTGDHVVMTFSEGKIDEIKVFPGVEGKYFPEKMIKGREAEYNLPGFRLREPRKRR